MVGDEAAGCRTALLQDPFEELVRRLARRVAVGVEMAARSKGRSSGDGGGEGGEAGGRAPVAGGGTGFTEWGALLLRKEVRTLQQGLAALMETDSLSTEFDEVNELVSLILLLLCLMEGRVRGACRVSLAVPLTAVGTCALIFQYGRSNFPSVVLPYGADRRVYASLCAEVESWLSSKWV